MKDINDLIPSVEMTRIELEVLNVYWTQQLQRSFFPERGTAECDTATCEARLRLIESLIKGISEERPDKEPPPKSILPFDHNNPLFFLDGDGGTEET